MTMITFSFFSSVIGMLHPIQVVLEQYALIMLSPSIAQQRGQAVIPSQLLKG